MSCVALVVRMMLVMAGSPSTPSSQKTKRSRWIPPATPLSLSDGAGCSKGWLPSGTPSRVPSGLCPNASLLAVPSAASSVQAVAAPAVEVPVASSVAADVSKVEWTCTKCLKVVTAATASSLQRKRRVHLALHVQAQVPAAAILPPRGPEPRVWTCHHCGQRFEAPSGLAFRL